MAKACCLSTMRFCCRSRSSARASGVLHSNASPRHCYRYCGADRTRPAGKNGKFCRCGMDDALVPVDPRRPLQKRPRATISRRQKIFADRALRRKPWSTGCKDCILPTLQTPPRNCQIYKSRQGGLARAASELISCEMPNRMVPAKDARALSHPPLAYPSRTLCPARLRPV